MPLRNPAQTGVKPDRSRTCWSDQTEGKTLIRIWHFSAIAAACFTLANSGTALGSTQSADSRLAMLAQAYFGDEWAFSPASATAAGVHDFDGALSRVTPRVFAAEISRLHSALSQIDAIDPATLSLDGRIDR